MKAKIWKPSNVYPTAKLGSGVSVGKFAEIGKNCVIGDDSRIGAHAYIPEGVTLGKNVFWGPHAVAINDRFPTTKNPCSSWEKTTICEGVSIGANATIMCGIKIGKSAMIGAGSVVLKDVPPGEIWAGNPAKKIGIL